MKQWYARVLAFTMMLSLMVPAAAAETAETPTATPSTATTTTNKPDYEKGYKAGYELGHTAGMEEGKADTTNSPDGQYEWLSDGLKSDYDTGYNHGLYDGYYEGYEKAVSVRAYQKAYDAAFVEAEKAGVAQALKDYPNEKANPYTFKEAYSLDSAEDGTQNGQSDGWNHGYSVSFAEAAEAAAHNKVITDRGGAPGQLGVMLNGKYIQFPDARPELCNGRTMVPVRAILETMGATVTYPADKTVVITCKDSKLTFTIGSDKISVEQDGKTKTVQMDCSTYIKADRTYVPMRFLSEACGYHVFWDGDYQTAVLLDKKAVVSKIDSKFETMNKLMAAQYDLVPKQAETTTDFTASAEVIDTVKGNQTYKMSGNIKTFTTKTAFRMDGKIDGTSLGKLLDTLRETNKDMVTGNEAALDEMKAKLQSITFSLLLTENGDYYMQMPLYNDLLKQADLVKEPISNDSWIKLMNMGDMSDMMSGTPTMGDILYLSLSTNPILPPVEYYDTIQQSAKIAAGLVGDSCFTKNGLSYQLKMDLSTLLPLMELDAETQAELQKVLKDVSLNMTLDLKGNYSATGKLHILLDDLKTELLADLTTKGSTTEDNTTLNLKLKNQFNFSLTGKSSVKETKTLPAMTLPTGAKVVDLSQLLAGLGS